MKHLTFILLLACLGTILLNSQVVLAQNGFTQQDREILVKTATKVEDLDKRLAILEVQHQMLTKKTDDGFDSLHKKTDINDSRTHNYMIALMSLVFTSVIGIFAYIFWIGQKPSPRFVKSMTAKLPYSNNKLLICKLL